MQEPTKTFISKSSECKQTKVKYKKCGMKILQHFVCCLFQKGFLFKRIKKAQPSC